MKASLGHIGINLSGPGPLAFWKELLAFLEFRIVEDGLHFDAGDGTSYFCVNVAGARASDGFHRRRVGLNHVAFRVASAALVDRFVSEFLVPRGIAPLYGGARAYPEYSAGYYAVYFEDPDRIKIEVVVEP
jgi:catechol 2,3-dioxygenase-like lactoylglutathione lyase family enzyme